MRFAFLLLLALVVPAAVSAAPDPAQTAAICGKRASCKVAETFDAGKSPTGTPLSVVEIRLGLADKPRDQEQGCLAGNGRDGGVEYWLLDGTAAPKQVLQLCNDGYGSSGVGEDEVRVRPNRLIHWQTGGSAWRWTTTVTSSLVPLQVLGELSCSYHNGAEQTGTKTYIDFDTLVVRSIAKDSRVKDLSIGCPDWPTGPARNFSPEPEKGVYGAYNLVSPARRDTPDVPAGGTIGDCTSAMTTAGAGGFVVFGTPAPRAQAAEIKVLPTGLHTLLIQVHDPLAANQPAPAGGSWVNLPHLEIWVGYSTMYTYTQLPLAELLQVGIDLEGKVYRGVGRAGVLPKVKRWEAKDEAGRPVTLLEAKWPDEFALLGGVAVVYSQAEAGRQVRLVSTTGIVNNRPLYLPQVQDFSDRQDGGKQARCRLSGNRMVRAN